MRRLSSAVTLRVAITADLHFDVPRSRAPAELVIQQINAARADAVLVIGDTATADARGLEECLGLFDAARPRWFIPGNHELWTRHNPRGALELLRSELPARIAAAGWRWLPGAPIRHGRSAVVGSLGWYDYAFAEPRLGLPQRFYEAKLSPGSAKMLRRDDLKPDGADVSEDRRNFIARWNDGRFIHGIGDDAAFLRDRIAELRSDLDSARDAEQVMVAVHVAPLEELLPRIPASGPIPEDRLHFAFTRAYLGSPAIGDVVMSFGNVRHIFCGHTHAYREAMIRGCSCVNVGSTYTEKRFLIVELPE